MAITTNVPSDNFEDLQRDVQDATRFVNGNTVFTNRTGKSIRPIPLVSDEIEADRVAVDNAAQEVIDASQTALNTQIPEAINALGLQYPPIIYPAGS